MLATYRTYLLPDSEFGEVWVEAAEGTEVETLLAEYGVPVDETSVILVNGFSPETGQILQPGDEVTAFPAMAGGVS
jgi:sulfur carrier protein ThiS